jgi:alpha-tubulin suppressor-like RCC1 family protein
MGDAANASGLRGSTAPRATRRKRSGVFHALVVASVLLLGCCLLVVGTLVWLRYAPAHPYVVRRSDVLTSVRAVVLGPDYSLAIKQDGTLWTWGENLPGQTDTESAEARAPTPARVGADSDWSVAAAGGSHVLALKRDGSLWAWSANTHGQVGDGAAFGGSGPVRVPSNTRWTCVAAGRGHSLAIGSDGALWAWGANDAGQLGDGTTSRRSAPTRVGTDTDWASVSAEGSTTVATRADGSLWAWGDNTRCLAADDPRPLLAPTRIGFDSGWASVALGVGSMCAVKRDGSLWAWGWDPTNHYGLVATLPRSGLERLGTGTGWKSVGAGPGYGVAVKTDGTLWAWGLITDRPVLGGSDEPAQVGTAQDWASVAAGTWDYRRTYAIKADGSVWTVELR